MVCVAYTWYQCLDTNGPVHMLHMGALCECACASSPISSHKIIEDGADQQQYQRKPYWLHCELNRLPKKRKIWQKRKKNELKKSQSVESNRIADNPTLSNQTRKTKILSAAPRKWRKYEPICSRLLISLWWHSPIRTNTIYKNIILIRLGYGCSMRAVREQHSETTYLHMNTWSFTANKMNARTKTFIGKRQNETKPAATNNVAISLWCVCRTGVERNGESQSKHTRRVHKFSISFLQLASGFSGFATTSPTCLARAYTRTQNERREKARIRTSIIFDIAIWIWIARQQKLLTVTVMVARQLSFLCGGLRLFFLFCSFVRCVRTSCVRTEPRVA